MKIYQYPYSIGYGENLSPAIIGTVQACCRGTAMNIAWTQAKKAQPEIIFSGFLLTLKLGKGGFIGTESETLESGRHQFLALQD